MIAEQLMISEASRRNLVARRLETFDEVHRALIPARSEPDDRLVATVAVDFDIFGFTELYAMAVIEIGHHPPGRLPQ